jgi:hypothetical protein
MEEFLTREVLFTAEDTESAEEELGIRNAKTPWK